MSLGLYTDVDGRPGRLIALAEHQYIDAPGRQELAARAAPGESLDLVAGTYWMMGLVSVESAIQSGGAESSLCWASWGGTALPNPAPPTGCTQTREINFYLVATPR